MSQILHKNIYIFQLFVFSHFLLKQMFSQFLIVSFVAFLALANQETLQNLKPLSNFDATIQKYPHLKQNIRPSKITELLNKMECIHQLDLTRILILQNRLFTYGKLKQSPKLIQVEKLLRTTLTVETIPDIYFLIHTSENTKQEVVKKFFDDSPCKQLPILAYKKGQIGTLVFQEAAQGKLDNITEVLQKYSNIQKLSLNRKQKMEIQRGVDITQILDQRIRLQKKSQLNDEEFQKWFHNLNLITIQETVQEFPFIKKNMDPLILADMFSKVNCGADMINYVIFDNEVYAGGNLHYHQRVRIIANFIRNIIQERKLPDMYFLLHINDQLNVKRIWQAQHHKLCREMPLFLMNKNSSSFLQQTKFLFPDPYIINNWQKGIAEIKKAVSDNPWETKLKKAFFRGLASGPNFYDVTIDSNTDFFKYFHRAALIKMSHENPDILEARYTPERFEFLDPLLKETKRRYGQENIIAEKVPQSYYCKYRYALAPDGFGAPWRRIPGILFSNSIMLRPYSQKLQWFYDKVIPNHHYIPIDTQLTDLLPKIKQMNQNDTQITNIYLRANEIAEEYLTPAAIKQHGYLTLKKYGEIQNMRLTQKAKQMIRKSGNNFNNVFLNLKEEAFIGQYKEEQKKKEVGRAQRGQSAESEKQGQRSGLKGVEKIIEEIPPQQHRVKFQQKKEKVSQELKVSSVKTKDQQIRQGQQQIVEKQNLYLLLMAILTVFIFCAYVTKKRANNVLKIEEMESIPDTQSIIQNAEANYLVSGTDS